MSILSPNKYLVTIPLKDISHEQFLVLAHVAAKQLPDYIVTHISENGLIIRIDKYKIQVLLKDEMAIISSETINGNIFNWGMAEKKAVELITTIRTLETKLDLQETQTIYEKLKPYFVAKENDPLLKPPITFISLFIPRKDYFVTPLLIDLHLFVYIILAFNGGGFIMPNDEVLYKWANYRSYILDGEWWRLFSCIFIHFGIRHLLMNMLSLMIIGVLTEPYMGRTKFVVAYFSAGIMASLVSIIWNHYAFSGGASGAIFGLFGVALILMNANLMGESKTIRWVVIVCLLGYIILQLIASADNGVDNAAHIGGVIGGIITGLFLYPSFKKTELKLLQWKCIGLLLIAVFAVSFTVCKTLKNDYAIYIANMTQYDTLVNKAKKVFDLPKDASVSAKLQGYGDSGIYYWDKSITLIDETEKLDLPKNAHERNQHLKKYCLLRRKSFELLYKAYKEDTDKYDQQISVIEDEIKKALDVLKP